MRHSITFITTAIFVFAAFVISCEKKKQSEGISPTYGTTGNPNPGYQTVTGNTPQNNPATENTSLVAGEAGWQNPSCGSTQSLTLKGTSGFTDVTLSFATAVKTGTYAVAATPSGTTSCAMTVYNAPNQPTGLVWYGRSGKVVVTISPTSINAKIENVVCTQQTFSYPTVLVKGSVGCNQ
jgi:hypothetical protein